MNNVILLKSGTKYTANQVNRLADELAKQNINPVCYTDDPEGVLCNTRDLPTDEYPDVTGWWWKLWLFAHNPGDLYLDLDVLIVGEIKPLLDLPTEWTAIKDPWQEGMYNTSAVKIGNGGFGLLWDRFLEDRPDKGKLARYGDQAYFTSQLSEMGLVKSFDPSFLLSYKNDILHGNFDKNCRVVYFHGKPKPWDINEMEILMRFLS